MNRRTVLRQSVKLAYATPLIAASMNLTDFRDAGASHLAEICPPCEDQLEPNGGCTPIPGCVPE
jgi:hypothetical protein